MIHVYHLTEKDTGALVVVFEARSITQAIETADQLDPPSRLLMTCAGSLHDVMYKIRHGVDFGS